METTTPTTSPSAELRERLNGSPLVLMLDVDGTLAPIAPRPEEAVVPADTRRAIAALAARGPAVKVALVSGRAAADARRMVSVANLWVVGNHGAETIGPDGETIVDPRVLPFRAALAAAARQLAAAVAPVPGVAVENKTWSLTVHWRLADQGIVPRLRALVEDVARRHGLAV
ncbi:MAG TPA: trehalose-phosphatase, partial [Gemmatimonadaceae bacterium]|nr:trehalose-phosphatase [Gemmatimonadaceae bacterium]